MNNCLPWTLLLVLQFLVVIPQPVQNQYNTNTDVEREQYHREVTSKSNTTDEKIISVRITSSVAVGRQNGKPYKNSQDGHRNKTNHRSHVGTTQKATSEIYMSTPKDEHTELPPGLVGANIEFIKQLYAKKGTKDHHQENVHPFQVRIQNQNRNDDLLAHETTTIDPFVEMKFADDGMMTNIPSTKNNTNNTPMGNLLNLNKTNMDLARSENSNLNKSDEILIHSSSKLVLDFTSDDVEDINSDDSAFFFEDEKNTNNSKPQKIQNSNESYDTIAESSIRSFSLDNNNESIDHDDDIDNVPLARSVSFPRGTQNYVNNIRRTTNLEREPKSQFTTISFSILHDAPKNLEHTNNNYVPSNQPVAELQKPLDHPIIYSEPAKIYSEPAKFYSEPAKIYSEPAKIYSEPAKVYSEPAKIYSEPAKFYSEPASLHLPEQHNTPTPVSSTSINTTPAVETISGKAHPTLIPEKQWGKKHEIEENNGGKTHGINHGVQETSTEKCQEDNCKVGYVVEGRQFKKYRVEERTSDGFIVGEYGVVRNEDGALRGVRYTADSEASPRLIYDALMKFLQLR